MAGLNISCQRTCRLRNAQSTHRRRRPARSRTPRRELIIARAGRIELPRLLTVAAIYWLYVTVSDILYAHSLRVGFGQVTTVSCFSRGMRVCSNTWRCFPPWSCLWLSLRRGWQPIWRAVPLQLLLAACFAVAAAPALWVGERLFSGVRPPGGALHGQRFNISSGRWRSGWQAPRASSSPMRLASRPSTASRGTKDTGRGAASYRPGERLARRPTGRITDAIVPAYSLQSAKYDSRPDRVGPAAGAVDGHPARRPAATLASMRGSASFPGWPTSCNSRASTLSCRCGASRTAEDRAPGHHPGPGTLGTQPDPPTPGGKCRGPRPCGP